MTSYGALLQPHAYSLSSPSYLNILFVHTLLLSKLTMNAQPLLSLAEWLPHPASKMACMPVAILARTPGRPAPRSLLVGTCMLLLLRLTWYAVSGFVCLLVIQQLTSLYPFIHSSIKVWSAKLILTISRYLWVVALISTSPRKNTDSNVAVIMIM